MGKAFLSQVATSKSSTGYSFYIYHVLGTLEEKISRYHNIVLVFRDTLTEVPLELREGFEQFCKVHALRYQVLVNPLDDTPIEKNTAYIVIDDEDLVYLVEYATANHLRIGKELGIISYNETSLKKVVAGDFTESGTTMLKIK